MTKIIAHRGFRSQFPENTLIAFEEALKTGTHGLELDIHLSKDGELVVFHDFELARLTGESGQIFDYTYSELSRFKVLGQARIPTLKMVLECFADFEKKYPQPEKRILNVEFKAGSQFYSHIESKTLDLCQKYLTEAQLIYSSFDHHALTAIKTLNPKAQTGVLTASSLVEPWVYLERVKADFYHPHYMALGVENLKALLEHQVKLNPYTVNDPKVAQKLIEAGIHAIITDFPDTMLDLIGKEKP